MRRHLKIVGSNFGRMVRHRYAWWPTKVKEFYGSEFEILVWMSEYEEHYLYENGKWTLECRFRVKPKHDK